MADDPLKDIQCFWGAKGKPVPYEWHQSIGDFLNLDVSPSGFWKPIGPAPQQVHQVLGDFGPVAGEVTDIAIDPRGVTDLTIYVATGNGGIWKTEDGGNSWRPLMDFMPSLSMGAVAIDPGNPDVIYAGSGNRFDGGHQFQEGAGLYKSVDGGETWFIADGGFYATVLPGPERGIYRIVCPAPDSLLVATTFGLYRSIDGGLNFGQNHPDYDNGCPLQFGDITSLILDTATPSQKVYFASSGAGIFPLTINADNSISISPSIFTSANVTNFDMISLAQAQPPDSRLFASVQWNNPQKTPSATYLGLYVYKTTSLGPSWQLMRASTPLSKIYGDDQSNYDLTVGIDPQDPQRVYLGFQQLWVSTDGGKSFPPDSPSALKIHEDHHALVFSPPSHQPSGAPSTFYVGTDGGLARVEAGSPNKNDLKFTNLNAGVATSLMRGIDMGRGTPAFNFYKYGGMQDTGTASHQPTDPGNEWNSGLGGDGDGARVAVDPSDPQTAYGFANESFIKTTNAGKDWFSAKWGFVGKGLKNRNVVKRIALEPQGTDPLKRIVYVSEDDSLYRSINAGMQFQTPALKVFGKGRGITAIEIDPQNSDRIWVGCGDGSVHFSADAGKTWDAGSFVTATGATSPVTDIAVDPSLGGRVVVTYFNDLNAPARIHHCYLTKDSGGSWDDISGTNSPGPKDNLPDLNVRSVEFDRSTTPSTIIVAVDGGVIASTDDGKTWQVYGVGLPVVSCQELCYDLSTGVLRVATYGRSAFEFTRPSGRSLFVNTNLGFDPIAVGQVRTLPILLYNCGDTDINISEISLSSPSPHFALDSPSSFPLVIKARKASEVPVRVKFQPQPGAAPLLTAEFQIKSDDPNSPAKVKASGQAFATPKGSRLAVNANLGFGEVNTGDKQTLTFVVSNTGSKDLVIKSISPISGSSDFNIVPAPAPNLPVAQGASTPFAMEFTPSSVGPLSAEFKIDTDASRASAIIFARGTGASHMSTFCKVVLIALGVAVVVGAGVGAYYLGKALTKK